MIIFCYVQDEQFETSGGYNSGIWIGGIYFDGSWTWTTSREKIGTADWYTGEPNDREGQEYCIQLRAPQNFKWNDLRCETPLQFICEGMNKKTKTARSTTYVTRHVILAAIFSLEAIKSNHFCFIHQLSIYL